MLDASLTYVGFGFGPIQSGLFLHEASRSGSFRRLVVAEVLPDVVDAVRRAGGHFSVNIAREDRVERAAVGPVEMENPGVDADRERLVEAVAGAQEIGTAVPSVAHYVADGPASLHRVLAEGLRRKAARGGPRAVVYAAENHNHAAEILEEKVRGEIPEGERSAVLARVRFLNTVIGKMSGAPEAGGLAPVTPGSPRAFLVEAFNRILITRIRFDAPFERGLGVFEEKDDLLPFEEAKLYGHNAAHALAAYLGAFRGVRLMADLRGLPGLLPFLRAAFVDESGAALVSKHRGLDPLFTPEGYARYADDLLVRMTNPHLGDTVERVGRDPARKLGWVDRLVGTIRLALAHGVAPRRFAVGAAAAALALSPGLVDPAPVLTPLWKGAPHAEQDAVLRLIEEGRSLLSRWRASSFPDLDRFARS